jgi:D-alanyl-D-alanine endopeptidase (penicillin-binding protein 7)
MRSLALSWILAFGVPTAVLARTHSSRSHVHGIVRSRSVSPTTREGRPNIQAQAALITDLSGGEYYAKNPDAVRPIASISKLMASLVVVDAGLKLDETQTIVADDKKVAWKGARSRLIEGMTLSNRDLLHAALIASDNRAVPALGRSVGMTSAQLAAAMTRKARTLGLHHTEFKDPTGLDDGNVSTPRETIQMLQAVLRNPTLAEILRKPKYVAQSVGKHRQAIEYSNTDMLVRGGHWQVHGGKTGYTDIARYCLVVAAKVGDRDVAMAFLGAEGKLTRFGDFTRAADWLLGHPELRAATAGTSAGPGVVAAESKPSGNAAAGGAPAGATSASTPANAAGGKSLGPNTGAPAQK